MRVAVLAHVPHVQSAQATCQTAGTPAPGAPPSMGPYRCATRGIHNHLKSVHKDQHATLTDIINPDNDTFSYDRTFNYDCTFDYNCTVDIENQGEFEEAWKGEFRQIEGLFETGVLNLYSHARDSSSREKGKGKARE